MTHEIIDLIPRSEPRSTIGVKELLDLGCPGYLIPIILGLKTPELIQKEIDELSYLHDDDDQIARALPGVLETREAHCFDGTLGLALPLLYIWGYNPRIVLINSHDGMDFDHNLAVYNLLGRFGTVAMSSLPILKDRPPIFRTLHDLMLSYFPHYTSDFPEYLGQLSMRGYTDPIDIVGKYGTDWFFRRLGDQSLMDIYNNYAKGEMCTDIVTCKRYPYPEE